VRNGAIVTTDGPVRREKEFIAGFDVIDCPDMETAVAIAASTRSPSSAPWKYGKFWKG